MIILGIDTSCDETSAGVVREGREVLSHVVHSQVAFHRPHGGVVPELASREHVRQILPVAEEALASADLDVTDLDGLAVTMGPGLVGALLVGLTYAKALALSHSLPLVGVNHLEGHILSIFLEPDPPPFPFVVLTVSGGHTSLYHVLDFGQYRLLGQTLDDAAGEAFDKVAKMLGLGYPGGPVIEQLARKGDTSRIAFPRAYLGPASLDFSFSGLKTAVHMMVKAWTEGDPAWEGIQAEEIAASFQEAVVDVLVRKALEACRRTGAQSLVAAGGVVCNGRLRARLKEACREANMAFACPRPEYCTDNGAMIALAGYYRLRNGETHDLWTDVRAKLAL